MVPFFAILGAYMLGKSLNETRKMYEEGTKAYNSMSKAFEPDKPAESAPPKIPPMEVVVTPVMSQIEFEDKLRKEAVGHVRKAASNETLRVTKKGGVIVLLKIYVREFDYHDDHYIVYEDVVRDGRCHVYCYTEKAIDRNTWGYYQGTVAELYLLATDL